MWVSDPTWENHVAIFSGAGFKVNTTRISTAKAWA
ncbi:hypothetical protein M8494_29210 [Serratia ureilytica]